ncbi:hypothetical protein Ssi03_18430 [Sphaerisporangium siamense]|nr:hypothetical protein Ssi03_18430 [Sphaerisporangium siamense]
MPPLVGGQVADYLVEAVIGRGGMATVFRARDQRLGRTVALKVLAPQLSQDQRFRDRFVRESRLVAGIDHPNIIPIYEAGESDELLFIAMRYVEGSDLRRLIQASGPLPVARGYALFSQIASALDAAHQQGLVHRDVKPANILVTDGSDRDPEHVYLTDFGLTKSTFSEAGLTSQGHFMGTPRYVAPEQIRGLPVDGRSDLYAFACVVYEALSGLPPFQRDTELALLYAHVSHDPPPLTPYRTDLPHAVNRVMARALAKSPGERYTTCREFVTALRDAISAEEPHSPPEGRPSWPPFPGAPFTPPPGTPAQASSGSPWSAAQPGGPTSHPDHGPAPIPGHGSAPLPGHGSAPAPGHGPAPVAGHGPVPGHGPAPAAGHGAASVPGQGRASASPGTGHVHAPPDGAGHVPASGSLGHVPASVPPGQARGAGTVPPGFPVPGGYPETGASTHPGPPPPVKRRRPPAGLLIAAGAVLVSLAVAAALLLAQGSPVAPGPKRYPGTPAAPMAFEYPGTWESRTHNDEYAVFSPAAAEFDTLFSVPIASDWTAVNALLASSPERATGVFAELNDTISTADAPETLKRSLSFVLPGPADFASAPTSATVGGRPAFRLTGVVNDPAQQGRLDLVVYIVSRGQDKPVALLAFFCPPARCDQTAIDRITSTTTFPS